MKLQEHDYGFEAVLPTNRTPFKIKTSAKLFDILSSGIYKDKILAVIRELSCNAYDAHVSANKKHVPFKLRLPTRLDPTFYVEDEGTGIDPERITDIYWTYGESSKTDSNDQIGALGLGSKSPFAYTKSSFVVKNRYQGMEYTYLCFINEDGMPDGSKISEELTDKLSGITVEFAVRPEDVPAFQDRTSRFFKRWDATLPTFVDQKTENIVNKTIEKVIEGTDWYLEKTDRSAYSDHQGAVAVQGNVPYPIEFGSIPKIPKDLVIIASNPFIITFDIGEINFASSREALQYDERTCTNLISRLQEVRQEVEKSFNDKVFKKGMTHLEFITNFRRTFREFIATIRYDAGYGVDTDTWYVKMLLNKQKTDCVSYDAISFPIAELISGSITMVTKGHQSFGIHKCDRRNSRSTRTFMKHFTSLLYKTKADVDGTLIYPTWNSTAVIKAGEELNFDWKNCVIPKRAEMTDYFRILQNAKLFDPNTKHVIPVDTNELTFYVNDAGGAGEARYKALNDRNGFFVSFDSKVSSVDVVTAELNELIKYGLKGAKISLISANPDNRPAIEKTKIETGTMRVKYRMIVLEKQESSFTVHDSAYLKLKEIDRTYGGDAVVKIADLQAEPTVLYVVKRRSPVALYDDSGVSSIISSNNMMALCAKYIFPELVKPVPVDASKNAFAGRDSIQVLVLNEGQIEWLKKRKVNLVGLRNLITDRISAMETTEKFSVQIENASILKNIRVIEDIYKATVNHKVERNRLVTVTSSSVFKETFIDFVAVKSNTTALVEQYAKVKILEAVKGSQFNGHQTSADISAMIFKRYPLMRLLQINSYMNKDDVHLVIDYIEQIDAI